jgi:hypothetical protein
VSQAPTSRKKQKLGKTEATLNTRWEAAVAALRDAELQDDGDVGTLPGTLASQYDSGSLPSVSPKTTSAKGKEKAKVPTKREPKPIPTCDTFLDEVVGEIVLAAEKGGYWPGKVIDVAEPELPHGAYVYTIRFFDSTTKRMPRSSFHVWTDDGFGECTVCLLSICLFC